ncbi:MAG: hypothetical protein DMG96_23365 [Acidobacteria bacterium]|nr:MAG: hypothetical protein DMG96_23365 [Acidobacteriota bacterium]
MKLVFLAVVLAANCCRAQNVIAPALVVKRTYPQPVATVAAALAKIQPTTSGELPTLDGFVIPSPQALDGYKKPRYQCTVRTVGLPSGGTLVRVSAKITAWHEGSHSGYEVLASNGRLESDLLDRLQDALTPIDTTKPAKASAVPVPDISAPMPQFPKSSGLVPPAEAAKHDNSNLEQEAASLEDILRNQSRPTNLVAVKQDQTPILESPRSDAKTLFLASAEDEFEVLDLNPEWVHIRISGLSRGWLRRSTIEMLDGSEAAKAEAPARTEKLGGAGASSASAPFSVSSEEIGTFPGDWGPLKGKSARIISVQQAAGSGRITSPQDKLQFAISVFKKEALAPGVNGLVLIFDAEDGGMVASTREALEQWRRGTISEASFWKQCLLDPPEILGLTN